MRAAWPPEAGWRLDKGYGWWDGDYRSTLYNHYLTPNSKLFDCWQSSPPHNPAIKAARSTTPGGVNVLFCDGHVAFVKDSVSLTTWRGLGVAERRRGDQLRQLLMAWPSALIRGHRPAPWDTKIRRI